MRRALETIEHAILGPVRLSATAEIAASQWRPEDPDSWCPRCGASRVRGVARAVEVGCARCAPRSGSAGSRRRGRPAPPQPRLGDLVVRLGRYEPPLSEWIVGVKHGGWADMGVALGALLGIEVKRSLGALGVWGSVPWVVTAVPTPWLRRLHRGVDHAACIAAGAGRALEAPVLPLLTRPTGRTQASRSARARRSAGERGIRLTTRLLGASARACGLSRRRWIDWGLDGHGVILVDDVRTTGTTLRRCVDVIRTRSPRWIVVAVVACADADRGTR